jgi:hypothetical protein
MAARDRVPSVSEQVRVIQIVHGALMGGVAMFIVVAVLARGLRPDQFAQGQGLVTYPLLGFAAFALLAHFAAPALFGKQLRQLILKKPAAPGTEVEASAWWGIVRTQHILAVAFLEGAAFASLIAYMIEGELVAVLVGGAILGLMALRFPTQSRLESWIEQQKELLYQERLESGS